MFSFECIKKTFSALALLIALTALRGCSGLAEEITSIDDSIEIIVDKFNQDNIMCRNEITGEQVDW